MIPINKSSGTNAGALYSIGLKGNIRVESRYSYDAGVSVTREIDGGLETLFLTLPAVITTDLRLNEPRYISLPNIVQAERKQIAVIPAESFSVDLTPRIKTVHVDAPEKRRSGIRLDSAADLVKRLKEEARVI